MNNDTFISRPTPDEQANLDAIKADFDKAATDAKARYEARVDELQRQFDREQRAYVSRLEAIVTPSGSLRVRFIMSTELRFDPAVPYIETKVDGIQFDVYFRELSPAELDAIAVSPDFQQRLKTAIEYEMKDSPFGKSTT